jgi:hypothetical protein
MFNIGKPLGISYETPLPKNKQLLIAENLRFVKRFLPQNVSPVLLEQLRELTRNFSLSLKCGDLLLLGGGWYVTHAGLIRLAKRCRCSGIQVQPARQLSDHATSRYAFRATVYKSAHCRGFVGYGDADPSNVSLLVRGAEMRIAETRAVNRALPRLVKSLLSLVCVSRLPSASDQCHPPFLPRRAREGTQFVDSSSGAPVSRGLRSSFSG